MVLSLPAVQIGDPESPIPYAIHEPEKYWFVRAGYEGKLASHLIIAARGLCRNLPSLFPNVPLQWSRTYSLDLHTEGTRVGCSNRPAVRAGDRSRRFGST